MPYPRLLHPVWIILQLQNIGETIYDPRARAPARTVQRDGEIVGTTVRLKTQVSYYFAGAELDYVQFSKLGIQDVTRGYFVTRTKDLKRAGLLTIDGDGAIDIGIQRGDRIVQLSKRKVKLYVDGFKDFAHYPKYGQTMFQVNFQDRKPSE